MYEAALEVAPGELPAFLERECGEDSELRNEVQRLLTTREQPPDWSSDAAVGPAAGFLALHSSAPTAMTGRLVGGYRIVREIGHGGMGSVYLAERADGAIHRRVAVKLARPSLRQTDLLERFRREREILALLNHPGVAHLMDAGSTEEGLPYLIMDYVDGKHINLWCDEHNLNVPERVRLMREVCAAVQYCTLVKEILIRRFSF